MATLALERPQKKRQPRNNENDDSEISVRWLLFYLRDKNALIKQEQHSCECNRRRRQLLSTTETWMYDKKMREYSAAASSINAALPRTTTTLMEAKTKTDSFGRNLWGRHLQRNIDEYRFRWHLKPKQTTQTGANNSTYLTYFILKFTQLCLIIIFLMSLLMTASQIAQQVNCLELTKSLPTTTKNQMNENKTPFSENVDIMPTTKIESNMEILKSIYFENRTRRTTKIEIETKNIASNTHSQFFSSYKNDKQNSSTYSLSSKSNNKQSSRTIEEREQKRYRRSVHKRSISEGDINIGSINESTITNNSIKKTAPKIKNLRKYNTTTKSIARYKLQQKHVNPRTKGIDNDIDIVKLTKLVMEGLGLKKLPDMQKVNISQQEYTSKYMEYLQRIQMHNEEVVEGESLLLKALPPTTLLTITVNSTLDITEKRWRMRRKRDVKDLFLRHRRQRHNRGHGVGGGGGNDMTTILLKFPFNDSVAQLRANGIDEANIRLMIMYSPSLATKRHGGKHKTNRERKPLHRDGELCIYGGDSGAVEMNQTAIKKDMPKKKTQSHLLNLKVFHNFGFGGVAKRKLLDMRKIRFESSENESDDTRSQWLEFDVTGAVRNWLERNLPSDATTAQSLGLEVQCGNCKRIGARILNDVSSHVVNPGNGDDTKFQLMPVLNIIGREVGLRRQMHAINEDSSLSSTYVYDQQQTVDAKKRKGNNCYKPHQRCCRRRLDIVFKEIKGFEFIIQPKVFDAGYCEGRCPPRHNPAHHHALLQSLIWKQDHKRAPRPCCAPSKLVKLEVLHVDEKDSDKLKISTWSDMQVIECACS